MNVIATATEDHEFILNAPVVTTTATNFRGAYARCAFNRSAATTFALGKIFRGGPVTSFWLHFLAFLGSSANGLKGVGLAKQSTFSKGIYVGFDNYKLSIYTYDGSTWSSALLSEAGASGSGLHIYDIEIVDFGASCDINVYVDQSAIASASGTVDASITGVTDLDCIALAGTTGYSISEVLVADVDTRAVVAVDTHILNGNGDSNAWDGDGYGGIDEITKSIADSIYTNTADETFLGALTDAPAGVSARINCVKIASLAIKSADSSIATLKQGVKKSGSAQDVDAGQTVPGAWDCIETYKTTVNSAELLLTDVDAMQLALVSAA